MKKRIAHLADIHIMRNPARHEEYGQVFARTVRALEKDAPDVIVIAGDLFHDYISASNEATLLAGGWLLALSAVAPVVIIRGNHDYDRFRLNRVDSVQTVVNLLDTTRVRYLNTSGFYRDQNLVFVTWHHGQGVSPWNAVRENEYPAGFYRDDIDAILAEYGSLKKARAAGLTFIDLFHDPLSGATSDNGQSFGEGGYLGTGALEGELALLGDIHLRQYFYRPGQTRPFAAYPGSLIQQHYGEKVTGHGYLLWDLAENTVHERDIANDTAYYTVFVGEGTDYDNLQLEIPYQTVPNANIRVYFTDRAIHYTQENKTKLRRYLRECYDAKEVRFDPHCVDQRENAAIQTELDAVDVTDSGVQRDLLVRYLQENGVAADVIERLLELDQTISDRLAVTEAQESEATGSLSGAQAGEYRLLRLRGENFQSTESFDVDFANHPGLWQITGLNECGKTTLASALMYVQYGMTLGTVVIKNGEVKSRPEKNGENRYINNKRDLDYCQVSADYEVGGTFLRLERRTERKWKRAKAGEAREISKCSTDFKVYLLTADGQIDTDESVDKRRRTEKLAQEIFGTFDDFLRSTFFSADTMAGLLSLDRAVFVDTILRDVKLDIYDRKLKVFRQWKNEVAARNTRLVLNQEAEEAKLAELVELTAAAEQRLGEATTEVAELTQSITKGEKYREEQRGLLQALPTGLETATEAELRAGVHRVVEAIQHLGTQEQDLLRRMDQLPSEYDQAQYQQLKTEIDQSKGWVRERETSIQGLTYQLDAAINHVVHVTGLRKLLVEEYKALQLQRDQEQQLLGRELQAYDAAIKQLEESKHCPTCLRVKDAQAIHGIALDIHRRQEEKVVHQQKSEAAIQARYLAGEESIRQRNLQTKAELAGHEASKAAVEQSIAAIRREIDQQQVYYVQQGEALATLDLVRQQVERRLVLQQEGASFPLKRRELELTLQENRQKLGQFEQAEKVRKHNAAVQERMAAAETRLATYRQQLSATQLEVSRLQGATIPQYQTQVQQLQATLQRYAEQQSRESLWSLYEKAIHRDGLPMQLVRRALSSINEQMAELLEGLNFSIYLDEELEFRMSDHRRAGANQHILQGSGMQRTFASLVLRLGLRRLNHRSRSNLLVMDEMLGKLDPENTIRYADLLRTATASVEHVMIIEHHGEGSLQPDRLLKVSAKDGVSRYELVTA